MEGKPIQVFNHGDMHDNIGNQTPVKYYGFK
jgi:hypothetical protein